MTRFDQSDNEDRARLLQLLKDKGIHLKELKEHIQYKGV